MPTVIVNKARGLFQKAATTANKAGTFSGHKIAVKDVGRSATTLTEGDSGKTILLGDANAAAYIVQVPVVEGWHADFILTGANGVNTIKVSGSLISETTTVTALGMFGDAADGGTNNLSITSAKELTFATAATAGTSANVKVIKDSGDNFFLVFRGLTNG